MNRRGKTTRNGEFPNLQHENNFMCTCIAITQTARERKGRLALDRRGKTRGKGPGRVEPTKTHDKYPRRSGFCEIFELLNNFFQTPLRFPRLFLMLQDISNVICLTESSLKVKMIIAVVDAVSKESLKRSRKVPYLSNDKIPVRSSTQMVEHYTSIPEDKGSNPV